MKMQATVVLGFQARTLTDAGTLLDEVLAQAREREDVEIAAVELASPPGDHVVTLPPVAAAGRTAPGVPFTGSLRNGS